MPKYLIVLDKKADKNILDNYEVSNVEIHLDIIAFANMTRDEAHRLSKNNLIKSVELDGKDSQDGVPDTRHDETTTSYAFKLMNIDKFHDEGLTGRGMKVAILDTGIQKHVNLKVEDGINVYDSSKSWNTDLANAHGTTVAGVLNAQGLNGQVLGIIPDAKLYCVRIDDGTGPINTVTWSSQIAGISWAVENGFDNIKLAGQDRTLLR